MSNYTVGVGGDFATIAAALKAVKPGDVVDILPGVYKDALKVTTPNTTWRAAIYDNRPVLDGSYSHEWAKKSGTSWRDLVYRSPAGGASGNVVIVAADGVTIDGLIIRNSGGAGISAGAVDGLTVRNCTIEFCYDTCIVVNGAAGGDATNIVIEDNICRWSSVKKFDPDRKSGGSPQAVSGNIKVTGRDIIVRGNVVSNGHGEGINIGKDAFNVKVIGNVVYDTAHLAIYVNRGADVDVENNVVFFTGDPAYIWTDGDAPCGMGLRDEGTKKGNWITSRNVRFVNNTIVNAGYSFLLNPEKPTPGLVVSGNTFVAGPLTRKGINLLNAAGSVFADNVIAAPDGLLVVGTPSGAECRRNRWSSEPPAPWRGPGDEYGRLGLKAPGVMPTAEHEPFGLGIRYEIDLANYRRDDAPEPPDPPIDPPIDPPPPEPEPGRDDIVRGVLAQQGELLETAGAAITAARANVQYLIQLMNENQGDIS